MPSPESSPLAARFAQLARAHGAHNAPRLVVSHTLPDACVSENMTASRVKKASLVSAISGKKKTKKKKTMAN